MRASRTTPLRILVGAASFADARTALNLARHLARRAPAEIGGLLVEDILLGELPRLGRQRIVSASGTLQALPDARQIARMVERDAKDFAAALAGFAAATHPLERRQGDLTVSVMERAKGWDILVFGQRETHALRGRVVLIAPPAGPAPQVAELAREIARATGTTILSLGLAQDGHDGADETCANISALVARIGRLNCSAVVLDARAGPIRDVDTLRALLAAAHCPVVVVGGPPATEPPRG